MLEEDGSVFAASSRVGPEGNTSSGFTLYPKTFSPICARSQEDDGLAFTLAPELERGGDASISERQRLRSGPPSSGLAGVRPGLGAGQGSDRWGRLLTGISVFVGTLVLVAAMALVAGLLGGGSGHASPHEAAHAHFYVVRIYCSGRNWVDGLG